MLPPFFFSLFLSYYRIAKEPKKKDKSSERRKLDSSRRNTNVVITWSNNFVSIYELVLRTSGERDRLGTRNKIGKEKLCLCNEISAAFRDF